MLIKKNVNRGLDLILIYLFLYIYKYEHICTVCRNPCQKHYHSFKNYLKFQPQNSLSPYTFLNSKTIALYYMYKHGSMFGVSFN